jgi:hypothetical protein
VERPAGIRRQVAPGGGRADESGRCLTGILLTQRMMTSPEPTELARDFWAAAYTAIDG